MIFTKYNDPAHGWVKVTRKQLVKWGLVDKVSSYSYAKGGYVYLEEDCDATILFNRLEEMGVPFSIRDKYSNKMSKVRLYGDYNPTEIEKFTSGIYNDWLEKGVLWKQTV